MASDSLGLLDRQQHQSQLHAYTQQSLISGKPGKDQVLQTLNDHDVSKMIHGSLMEKNTAVGGDSTEIKIQGSQ